MKESEYYLSYQTQKFINKTAKKTYSKAWNTRVRTGALQLYSLLKVQKFLPATPQFGRSEASSNSCFLTFSSAFCSKRHNTCYTLTRNVHNKSNSSRYENGKNLPFFLAYSRDKVRCFRFSPLSILCIGFLYNLFQLSECSSSVMHFSVHREARLIID